MPVTGERLKKLDHMFTCMAPIPKVRNVLLNVLTSAERPLSFSEVRQRTAKILLGKRVHEKTIAEGLKILARQRLAEKEIVDGKVVWALTSRYYVDSLQSALSKLITKGVINDIGKIRDYSSINMTIPHTVFLIPPQDELQVADTCGRSLLVSWSSPAEGTASTLMNDFLCLNETARKDSGMMIMWAYWIGLKIYAQETTKANIQRLRSFMNRVNDAENKEHIPHKASGNAVLEIVALTEELLAKENLSEFISFAAKKKAVINGLERTASESFVGDIAIRLFGDLTTGCAEKIFVGLNSAGVGKRLEELFPRHMLAALDVWNLFIQSLIGYFAESDAIKTVTGSLEESSKKLEDYLCFLPSLSNLMKRRKVAALYLWGFPDFHEESEMQFKLSDFESWLDDVKSGYVDHRVWLFEEKTINRVRRAYRSVVRGRTPLPQRIDKEDWTLLDIYNHHPKGRDPHFWLEIVEALTSRNKPENLRHQKDAVPEGMYSEFKKKERQAIVNVLDEEERKLEG